MNKIEFKKLDKEQMIIAFNQLKDDYSNLFNENNQLKEVIEEVREAKDEYVCTEEYCGKVGIKTTEFIEKLGQILDKVKGE